MGTRNQAIWVDTVLKQIKTALTTTNPPLFDPNYCFFSLDEDQREELANPPADFYAKVVPGAQRPEAPIVTGAAPGTLTPISGDYAVIVCVRLALDQEGRDDAYLSDLTLGALEKERLVIQALQQYDPQDSNGNPLFSEPMRLAQGGFNLRPRRALPGWGCTASAWEVKYMADLTSTRRGQ